MFKIDLVENLISLKFSDKTLLETALTHPSFHCEDKKLENYEKLEFLGDSVLNLIIGEEIFKNHNHLSVGGMTKLRAKTVCTENLSLAFKKLELLEWAKIEENEKFKGKKVFADLFESLVGAIYLDKGMTKAKSFILEHLSQSIETFSNDTESLTDYKSMVQELAQKEKESFEYTTISKTGLEHEPIFTVSLTYGEKVVSTAQGDNIRKAQKKCAKAFLKKRGKIH